MSCQCQSILEKHGKLSAEARKAFTSCQSALRLEKVSSLKLTAILDHLKKSDLCPDPHYSMRRKRIEIFSTNSHVNIEGLLYHYWKSPLFLFSCYYSFIFISVKNFVCNCLTAIDIQELPNTVVCNCASAFDFGSVEVMPPLRTV